MELEIIRGSTEGTNDMVDIGLWSTSRGLFCWCHFLRRYTSCLFLISWCVVSIPFLFIPFFYFLFFILHPCKATISLKIAAGEHCFLPWLSHIACSNDLDHQNQSGILA